MKNLFKNKALKRSLLGLSLAIVAVAGIFILSIPAHATISAGDVNASSAANLIAGTVNADYTVTFATDITATTDTITVTFPATYTVTDGSLGITAVSNGTPGIITAGGGSRTVTAVVGDSTAKTIAVTISTLQDLNAGANTFTILTGITNPTVTGLVAGNFSISTGAAGETPQTDITTETITADTASYLVVTGTASVAVGANNELTVTAKDQYGNTATGYTGDKTLTFSGPLAGPNETTPKIETVAIGTGQTVTFASGVTNGSNLTFIGYAIESTTIDVSDGSINSTGDEAYDLNLSVTVGAAASLVITGSPTDVVSGIVWTSQPTVTAYDAGGNIATGYTSEITVQKASGDGTMAGNVLAASAGVAEFTAVKYSNILDGEAFTIEATDSVLTSAASSSIDSDVVATKLVFTTEPSAAPTSGTAFDQQPVVKAEDADNAIDTGFTGLVTLTDSAAGALSGDVDILAVLGVATFTDVAYINSAVDHETFTLNADEAGDLTNATSAEVNPNIVANALAISVQPASIISGVSMTQPVIQYVLGSIIDTDVNGDIITVTENGDGSVSGDTEAAVNGVASFSTDADLLYIAAADGEAVTFTFTDDAAGLNLSAVPATSDALTADVVATKLVWQTDPSTCDSGLVCTVQGVVRALNANNTLDTGYVSAVTVGVSVGSGTILGTANQGAMTAGVLTTTGIGYTAASDNETFKFTADSGSITQGLTGDISSDIVATKLIFTVQPSATATSGTAFAQQPRVSAENAADQVDTDFTGTVTLTNSADGALTGDVDIAAISGVATFTDVVYTNATVDHETFTLNADEAGDLTNATSDSVNPNIVANALAVGTQPALIVSHVSMTQPVINFVLGSIIDTDINGDVITATENGNGAIAGGETATAISGVATFSGMIYNALADGEAVTFTFTDDAAGLDLSASPATSGALTANVVASKFLVTLNTNTPNAGTADTMTLTAANVASITDTGYDPTGLTFTMSDSDAALLSTHTSPNTATPTIPDSATIIAAFASGVASLPTFTLVNAEILGAITVSDGTLSGDSASVSVRNLTTASFRVTPESLSPTTGTAYDLTTTAIDTYGNTVSGANGGSAAYTGQVLFDTTASSPTWHTPWVTFITGDAGVKVAANAITFNTAESSKTITASNVGATLTGTSSAITPGSGVGSLTVDTPVRIILTNDGTANNSYTNGWEWKMRVTLPTNKTHFALKFINWTSGSNTLAVTDNMEYYSEQIAGTGLGTATLPVSITAASTYPADLNITTDADSTRDGIQTDIHVKVKIPASTTAGSYNTTYNASATTAD